MDEQLVTVETTQLPVDYSQMEAVIAEAEKQNANAVFVYEDPKGNKAARSHVYMLRQVKGKVDKRHRAKIARIIEEALQPYADSNIDEIVEVLMSGKIPHVKVIF